MFSGRLPRSVKDLEHWCDRLPVLSALGGALLPLVAALVAAVGATLLGRRMAAVGEALAGLLPPTVVLLLLFLGLGMAASRWASAAAIREHRLLLRRVYVAYGGVLGAAAAALTFLLYLLCSEPTGPYSSIDILLLALFLAPHYLLGGLLSAFVIGAFLGWLVQRILVPREKAL